MPSNAFSSNFVKIIILTFSLLVLFFLSTVTVIAQSENTYEQLSFPVTVNGSTLTSGLAGGLNTPQISSIDLNRDGIKDLFIFDRSGNVILTLINDGNNYTYDPSYLDIFPPLEEWVVIRDYNKDGVEDIFSSSYGQGPQGVEVYTGSIVGGRLHYEMETFAGRPSTMLNIPAGSNTTHLPVDYIDYPDINDIDGDGDLDILSFGPNSGYMHWYRNMASENNWSLDSLRFRLEDFCWGKFFESGISSEITLSPSSDDCAMFRSGRLEARHAGSTVLSWDLDNNGQKDLLIGDVGNTGLIALYNEGETRKAHITDQELNFPDYDVPADMPIFLASFAVDYDLDNDNDLIVTPNNVFTAENKFAVWRYENVGSSELPEFRFRQNDYIIEDMVDVGLSSAPCFVDHNGDGLMDIVIGSGGFYNPGSIYDARLFLLENTGSIDQPKFELVDEDYLGLRKFSNSPQGSYFFTPTFGDLDDDGDLDVIVGEIFGKLFFGENIAGPDQPIEVENWTYNYMDISVRSYSSPFLIDLNEDGLLDLVVGARQGNNDANDNACSNFYYFQNTGTASSPQFISDPDQMPNTRCLGNALFRTETVSPYASPTIVKTGDNLMLIAGNEEGKLRLFTNIKGNIYGDFSKDSDDLGKLRSGSRLHIALADIDNDKFYELVAGNYRGGIQIYQTDIASAAGSFVKDLDVPEWSISPNPVSSENVRVRITPESSNWDGIYDIHVFDAIGRLVESKNGISGDSYAQLELSPGTYIVRIVGDKGVMGIGKLLVTP